MKFSKSSGSGHYSLTDKRLYVAILAHQYEEVLEAQIQNILEFNPDAGVVLYNGGTVEDFGRQSGIPICPYSRPIQWIYQGRVLYDVMKWLEEEDVKYEYLISFDHDMLFVKEGFEQFLDHHMTHLDCMGWQMLKGAQLDKFPAKHIPESFWNEWTTWRPIFGLDDFLRYFNPGQVYKRSIIQKMISHLQYVIEESRLDRLFERTEVLGFEEFFSATLAKACGGKCGEYPSGSQYNFAVRWGNDLSLKEVKRAIQHPDYYWIHPVKNGKLIQIHEWLQNDRINRRRDTDPSRVRKEEDGLNDFNELFRRTSSIKGWLTDLERSGLSKLPASVDEVEGEIVEIGSYMGKSTVCLGLGSKYLSKKKRPIHAIDPFKHDRQSQFFYSFYGRSYYNSFWRNIRRFQLSNSVIPIKKYSHEAHVECPLNIALLFIDGDHSYERVKYDIDTFVPRVSLNGLIAFHDYTNPKEPGVKKAVDELLATNQFEVVSDYDTLKVIKKIQH